jgi:diguanylate cyclase
MTPEAIPVVAVVVILAIAGLLLVLVTYTVATARARAHARSALASTEARFRIFFEHSPIGASVVGPDGRLLSVNDAFCRFLGRSPETLTGLSASDITAPEDLEATNDFHRRLLAGERDSWEMEKRYLTGDGRHVWGHVYTTLARNHDGSPLFFLTHVVDIDETRRAASELRASQARFMTLLEMIPLPLAYVAADGRVSFMNERFVQVFGYTASEVPTITDWWRVA